MEFEERHAFQKQESVYSELSRRSDQESLVDPDFFSRQCTEIDDIANGTLLHQSWIEAALRDAVQDCKFCVSIADPRRDDCPLIAVSDEFLTMTGYLREEVVGKNCRFLNRNCYLEPKTFNALRRACKTGAPFTGVILNRRKSGDLFMNLVNLQGLVVAKNPRGDPLWFVVGIQADVTHVCLEEAPEQLPKLHEVADLIRQKLTSELTTMAMSSAMIAETTIGQSESSWWLLPDPNPNVSESRAFSRQKTLIDTVNESKFTNISDECHSLISEFPSNQLGTKATTSARLSNFARQQSQQIDSLVPNAINVADIDEAVQAAIRDCHFSVSIADPRANDCPLVAVSDQFEQLTGYSREEIIGKNCRFLNQNCPLGESDLRALREACLTGSPFCKIIVNRRKSGDLFLNFLDLRGVTIARNVNTREELWFLVGIQADVTDVEELLPKDHLKKIQEVTSSIRAGIADQLSLMALAGSFAAGCLSGESEVLWVPVESPQWMKGEQDDQANSAKQLQWYLEQVSPHRRITMRQKLPDQDLGSVSGYVSSHWLLPPVLDLFPRLRQHFWGSWLLTGIGTVVLLEMIRTPSWYSGLVHSFAKMR